LPGLNGGGASAAVPPFLCGQLKMINSQEKNLY